MHFKWWASERGIWVVVIYGLQQLSETDLCNPTTQLQLTSTLPQHYRHHYCRHPFAGSLVEIVHGLGLVRTWLLVCAKSCNWDWRNRSGYGTHSLFLTIPSLHFSPHQPPQVALRITFPTIARTVAVYYLCIPYRFTVSFIRVSLELGLPLQLHKTNFTQLVSLPYGYA